MPGDAIARGSRRASWRPGSLPTTAAGIARALVILFIGLRLATLVQMAPALARGLDVSPNPAGYVACAGVALLCTAAYVVLVIRADRPLTPAFFGADIAVAVCLFVAGAAVVPVDERLGTWVGYMPGYAMGVLLCGSALDRTGAWLGGLLAVVAGHLAYAWSALTSAGLGSMSGDVIAYAALAAVARAAVGYVVRVGQGADLARATAVELGRREEEYRARLAMHNGAAIMRLLGEPDLDPEARRGLERQAELEAARMRAYLRGGEPEAHPQTAPGLHSPGAVSLAAAVCAVTETFVDLPLYASVELGRGVIVEPSLADAVQRALGSVLLNAREHADARQVVVHLDAPEPDLAAWTLTVHDDGRGFDTAATDLSVGLREVVVGGLARHGVEAVVDSLTGAGTTVTMTRRSQRRMRPTSSVARAEP